VVKLAQGTQRAIALEDLSGIRKRVTVRRDQRATLHSWSFFQLRMFLAYKAQLAGVTVIPVDPRNTSRTCPQCIVSINAIVLRKANSPVCPVDFLDSQTTSRLVTLRVGRLSTRQT
jgi:IS605 OrfB family transposase